jgi:DNA-binding NarL/FixJ family response regulator
LHDRAIEPQAAPVDVAVATGPALVRDVLSRALAESLGLRVVDFDPTPANSGRRLQRLQPRVLIIDAEDSSGDREEVIRALHRASPSTRILVLTSRSGGPATRRFVAAGAYAVLESRSDLRRLAWAVDAARAGRACARSIDADAAVSPDSRPADADSADSDGRLTAREWQIAELVSKGLRNKGIARQLNITVDTVKTHLNNAFRKLRCDGRLALAIVTRARSSPRAGR